MSKIRILVALLTTAVMALTIASCGKDVEKKENSSKADVSSVATEDSKTEDKDSTADTENDETSESKSNDDNSTDGDSSVVKGTGIVIEDFINLDEWEDENVVIIGGDESAEGNTNEGENTESTEGDTDESLPPNLEQGWGELL